MRYRFETLRERKTSHSKRNRWIGSLSVKEAQFYKDRNGRTDQALESLVDPQVAIGLGACFVLLVSVSVAKALNENEVIRCSQILITESCLSTTLILLEGSETIVTIAALCRNRARKHSKSYQARIKTHLGIFLTDERCLQIIRLAGIHGVYVSA